MKLKTLAPFLLMIYLAAQPVLAAVLGDTNALKKIIDSAAAKNVKHPQRVLNILSGFPYRAQENYPFHLEKQYLYMLGQAHLQLKNMEQADSVLSRLLKKALKNKDSGHIARSYNARSFLYSINENGQKAVEFAKKSLQYVDSSDSRYISYMANLANAYGSDGQYYKKLQILNIITDEFEARGDSANLATILNNSALMWTSYLGNDSTALKLLRKALVLNNKIKSKFGLARNYANLGLVFNSLQNYDSAYYYLRQSLKREQQTGYDGNMAITYYNLGENRYHLQKWDEALNYYKKCLRSSRQAGIALGVYYGSIGQCKVYLKTGMMDSARYYLQQAQQFIANSNNREIRADYHKTSSEYYEQAGNYKKALNHRKQYEEYRDSTQQKLQERKLLGLQTQYQTKLTKAENKTLRNKNEASLQKLRFNQAITIGLLSITVLLLVFSFIASRLSKQRKQLLNQQVLQQKKLQKQNEQLKAQEVHLSQLNALKDQILSVLGHDLRSPLASISGALEIMQNDHLPKSDFNNIVEHLRRDTDNTLGTLENILNWARLKDGSETLFRNEESAEELMQSSYQAVRTLAETKNITLKSKVPPGMKLWVDKNQFLSIIRNLTNNAIKFTPQGGTVKIKFTQDAKHDSFTVSDEGKGMPNGIIDLLHSDKTIKSTAGTDGEKGTGIGLKLVRDFVKAHGGHLEIQTKDTGTCVKVCFPNQAGAAQKTPTT